MKRVLLPSGNTLDVQAADFEPAIALVQAVAGVIANNIPNIKIGTGENKSLTDLMQEDVSLAELAAPLMRVIASKEVYALLWPCFEACLYNGNKIDKHTFNDEKNRKDFFPVVVEMFKASVLPFIGGLDLSSLTKPAQKPGNQNSK